MKEIAKGIIFWSILLGTIFFVWGLAEFLAAVITMKTIIKAVIIIKKWVKVSNSG